MNSLSLIKPIELITLPSELDGHNGLLRATGICQINADNDVEAIRCWLDTFQHSKNTYRAFRKEAERFLLWSVLVAQKPVSSLLHDDFVRFQQFLAAPPADWISERRQRTSDEWRPFMGPLSSSSIQTAMNIVNNLLSWLVDAGYLGSNPLALQRNRRRKAAPMPTQQLTGDVSKKEIQEVFGVERVLSEEEWGYLLDAVDTLPQATHKQRFVRARLLFVLQFGVLCYPRVSEISNARMCDIRQINGLWWWVVLGKGQKFAKVPVTQQMLDVLIKWREELGLSPLPSKSDESPLLRSITKIRVLKDGSFEAVGSVSGLSDNMVYKIIKEFASRVAVGAPPSIAKTLSDMSPHWLRHTGITFAANTGIDKRYLQLSARHDKAETTELYTHTDDKAWHAAYEKQATYQI